MINVMRAWFPRLASLTALCLLLLMAVSANALKPPPDPGKPAKQTVEGVTSWDVLANGVELDLTADDMTPKYNKDLQALEGKEVILQGFMMPLEQGEKQKKFLLTAMAPTCPYCLPGGPESMVEVTCKSGVKTTFEDLAVKGKLELVKKFEEGIFFRLHGAEEVKK